MVSMETKPEFDKSAIRTHVIDNENPIFSRFFFWKMRNEAVEVFGCHGINNNCFSFHGYYLNLHCYQFQI
jgi:hypothetical protein